MHSTDDVQEVDTGSFTISYRVHVAAPVETLWAIVVNPHRHHELDGGKSLSQKVTGPQELALGDAFHIWMRQSGVPYTLPMLVVTAQPLQHIAWQHPAKHVWRWSFEVADDGGTWVAETFDYQQVPPWMLRLWKLVDVYGRNAANIRTTLHRLQERYAQEGHD